MKKILLAYDGTEPAKRALATASQLARAFEGTVTVVSVVPMHAGRSPVDPWDDADVHARELAEARDLLEADGIAAELVRPVGDVADRIETIAREGAFDVIVLGSRGLGSVARFLQGSVSKHVATHADATVVIAH